MTASLTISVDEAAELLGVSRRTAYAAIQAGTFPVKVIRVNSRIRIPRAELMRLLGAEE